MEQRSKPQSSFVNVGSSLLLVTFLVLCLVTFATLSLSGAVSDKSFSERMANRKTRYYAAVNQAEEILAAVDARLAESGVRNESYDAVDFQRIDDSITYDDEEQTLKYQVPVDEGQALFVTLRLSAAEDGGRYQILQWQVQNTEPWTDEAPLQLMPIS